MAEERPESRSLTETAYMQLRGDIIACRLRPGERLKINDLCARLGVSLSATREALSRLSAEGLVTSEAQKGFRVAPVSLADLRDLTSTRVHIETLCLRSSIAVGGIEWETGLVAAYHRLSRTPERTEGDEKRLNEAWAAAHADYHRALVAACDSVWLKRLRELLYDQSERYRRLSVPASERGRDLDREHRDMMEAALAGDADRAARLLADHLALTMQLVTGFAGSGRAALPE